MITFAPPAATLWHFDDGNGRALCGLPDVARITDPHHAGRVIFASSRGVCPDCWQEFQQARQTPPIFWYQEVQDVSTTKRKASKPRRRTAADIPAVNGDDADVVDLIEQDAQQVPPGATSTVTPAGIARLDPHAREAAAADARGGLLNVPIGVIAASPYQPRIDPGEAKIAELAAAIKDWGFKGPIIVRPVAGGTPLFGEGEATFELIDGERRLRAAEAAGLLTIPALIEHLDDAAAEERVLLANEGREDLSPLERGRVIKRLLERGLTQEQVASRMGFTQGTISNKVRILELPIEWLDGTIHPDLSRSEAHLREVAAYRHSPALLAIIADCIKEDWKDLPPVKEFGVDIAYAIYNSTESLMTSRYVAELGRHVNGPKLTPEQRTAIEIVKVRNPWGGKEVERVANGEAYEAIWQAHIAKAKERDAKKAAKAGKAPAAGGKAGEPELSARVIAERERAKAEQFARRLYAVKIDWLQYLIACELEGYPSTHAALIQRVLLYIATSSLTTCSAATREALGKLAVHLAVPEAKPKKSGYGLDTWPHLAGLAGSSALHMEQAELVTQTFVASMVWINETDAKQCHREPGAQNLLPVPVIEDMAAEMGIDLAAAWKADMMGPLTERYFGIHSKDQLAALAKELRCTLPDGPKGEQVAHLIEQRPARMPQEISKAKG